MCSDAFGTVSSWFRRVCKTLDFLSIFARSLGTAVPALAKSGVPVEVKKGPIWPMGGLGVEVRNMSDEIKGYL